MKALTFLALFVLQFPLVSRATEVDNFTDRDVPLNDSRQALNSKMNELMAQELEKTNNKYDCTENLIRAQEHFYKNLNREIGGFVWAKYENEVNADPSIDKRYVKTRNSIYRDLNFINGFAFYLARLGTIVNIGDNLVGTDKLGHFIGIGKTYFDWMRNKDRTLKEVMEYGRHTEETFFGSSTTGIFSYGDLVANYEGLLFWQSIFEGPSPYLKCVHGILVQQREFDWLDYVNDAWDESINCSDFRNEKIRMKVYKNISNTSAGKCPVVPFQSETIKRYSHTPVKILNLK